MDDNWLLCSFLSNFHHLSGRLGVEWGRITVSASFLPFMCLLPWCVGEEVAQDPQVMVVIECAPALWYLSLLHSLSCLAKRRLELIGPWPSLGCIYYLLQIPPFSRGDSEGTKCTCIISFPQHKSHGVGVISPKLKTLRLQKFKWCINSNIASEQQRGALNPGISCSNRKWSLIRAYRRL